MPSVRYVNQSAPFWDFIASLENAAIPGPSNPFLAHHSDNEDGEGGPHHGPPRDARGSWGWGPPGWHRGGMPHHPRGRHGPRHHHHHHGPPPPPGPHGPPPPHHRGPPPPEADGPAPPGYEDSPDTLMGDEKRGAEEAVNEKRCELSDSDNNNDHDQDGIDNGEESSHRRRRGHSHHRRGGRCGGRGRWAGATSDSENPHHGPHGRRGGPGGRHGAWGGMPFPPFANRWLEFLGQEAYNFAGQGPSAGNHKAADRAGAQDDFFTPEADVFDTPSSFVLHVSLPGAKKEDVSVDWDAEKSAVRIGGVLYRAGDEAFLATLAMDERKVGAFERTVRLGSRANPASVDVDGITAKLEDGVLVVEVPKLEAGFVDVRRVDIE